jgi:nucleotide-binding universal stress UspA family protein
MRILIATGGSGHSDLAVRLGSILAQTLDTLPTLLTVVPSEAERLQGEELLTRAKQFLTGEQQDIVIKVRVGEPAVEIAAEVKSGNFDLLVVGERMQHRILSRLLSPTSERVIARASCPVLIAKAMAHDFKRILICDSGSARSPLLRRFTRQLPQLLTPETDVTVLHVMSQMGAAPGVRGWELRADAETLMDAHTPEGELLVHDIELLEQSPANSQAKIRHGRVVDEILEETKGDVYDLVVIGAHRGQGWERILTDDLAHQIIRHVRRPILVVQHNVED